MSSRIVELVTTFRNVSGTHVVRSGDSFSLDNSTVELPLVTKPATVCPSPSPIIEARAPTDTPDMSWTVEKKPELSSYGSPRTDIPPVDTP
jgi:hypothetical protein